jgi:2-alkyl-3-oxoalkanoate reductase
MGLGAAHLKVLVTGGGGFLGGAILRQLADKATVRRSFSRGDYPELADQGVVHLQGSLSDYAAVHAAVEGMDVVYHTAALPGAWGSFDTYFQANVVGSRNILKAARAHGVKAIVYTSTPSVVHADEGIRGADESIPLSTHFLAHYPHTKAIAEQEMLAANSNDLRICALRPHLIWGPGDRHLIPRLVDRARRGRLRMIGPPSPVVDSCYIDDAASAHILAAEDLLDTGRSSGRAYFISQGEPWAIDELTRSILDAVGVEWVPRYVSRRTARLAGALCEWVYRLLRIRREPPMTRFIASQLSTDHWYDISAAQRDFGFEPTGSIKERLAQLKRYDSDSDP